MRIDMKKGRTADHQAGRSRVEFGATWQAKLLLGLLVVIIVATVGLMLFHLATGGPLGSVLSNALLLLCCFLTLYSWACRKRST
jgi:hypothetical protein